MHKAGYGKKNIDSAEPWILKRQKPKKEKRLKISSFESINQFLMIG